MMSNSQYSGLISMMWLIVSQAANSKNLGILACIMCVVFAILTFVNSIRERRNA